MKRHPYSSPKKELSDEVPEVVTGIASSKWPKWLSSAQAAVYLSKFRRKDGKPSTGAIRNMIYRKQLTAKKFLGRIMISRLDLDEAIRLSPQLGGV